MSLWEDIVSGDSLVEAYKKRRVLVDKKSNLSEVEANYLITNENWSFVSKTKKNKYTIQRDKDIHDVFENEVWQIFYSMGFTHMNRSNSFEIEMPGNSKQIDVFAMDENVCLFIECKRAEKVNTAPNFKTHLESINGNFTELCKSVEKQYGKKEFKYIFSTDNYNITDECADMSRMNSFGIYYINRDTLDYYKDLVSHLGSAAKFQLLGNIFSKKEVPGLECIIPAIQGVMGGKQYYSFLIEPEKLLKIAYVLHRNNANHLLMPTYQRIIKKERLTSIREFLNSSENNFFPNSLIVSIDTDNKGLDFEVLSESGITKSGTLHLPPKYRSVYVIDGQHRLYGYSDVTIKSHAVIPVVAFVDLEPNAQVKMFMDINENQKKVSKTLRNTLNIDLLWKSGNKIEKKEALMLRIADALEEDQKSPLHGRVLTGEEKSTVNRCITNDYIKDAIKNSDFLNCYKKIRILTLRR